MNMNEDPWNCSLLIFIALWRQSHNICICIICFHFSPNSMQVSIKGYSQFHKIIVIRNFRRYFGLLVSNVGRPRASLSRLWRPGTRYAATFSARSYFSPMPFHNPSAGCRRSCWFYWKFNALVFLFTSEICFSKAAHCPEGRGCQFDENANNSTFPIKNHSLISPTVPQFLRVLQPKTISKAALRQTIELIEKVNTIFRNTQQSKVHPNQTENLYEPLAVSDKEFRL